jgi:hypothetical protein
VASLPFRSAMSLLQVEEIHEHRSAPAFFDNWRGPSLLATVDEDGIAAGLAVHGELGQGHEESKWTEATSDDHLVPNANPDAIQSVSSCLSFHVKTLKSRPVVRHEHRPPSAPIHDS